MKALIKVTLKSGVLDPQGKAIEGALSSLGIGGVAAVRQGKLFEIVLDETNSEAAAASVERMCKELLANLVIENYSYELVPH